MFNRGRFNIEKFNVEMSTSFYTAPEVAVASTDAWYQVPHIGWEEVWNIRHDTRVYDALNVADVRLVNYLPVSQRGIEQQVFRLRKARK